MPYIKCSWWDRWSWGRWSKSAGSM